MPIYEQDFLDCSGALPKHNSLQVLEALWRGPMLIGWAWVVDLDIQSFFDIVNKA